jgi:hypothetical protein
LMWKSKGLSAVKEGARLTSRIHVFISLSSNITYHSISKQFEGLLEFVFCFFVLDII